MAVKRSTGQRENNNVEKCVNCRFYDRKRGSFPEGKVPTWGQCRRHSPHLNPATAKTYVVDGVWPLVRDDDWCGEWNLLMAASDARSSVALMRAASLPRPRGRAMAAGCVAAGAGDD